MISEDMETKNIDKDEVIDENDAPWVYTTLLLIHELGKNLKCSMCKRFLIYVAEHIIRNNYYAIFMTEDGLSFDEAVEKFEEEYREGIEELLTQLKALFALDEDEKWERYAKSRVDALSKLVVKESVNSLNSSSQNNQNGG